ncbi:hypothetical protein FBY40_0191 [Microbacterium sp. SLBN-154]|nr:hypothetical protein FBY40_0191 [Microbacterium sp. SLBN-154]
MRRLFAWVTRATIVIDDDSGTTMSSVVGYEFRRITGPVSADRLYFHSGSEFHAGAGTFTIGDFASLTLVSVPVAWLWSKGGRLKQRMSIHTPVTGSAVETR